MRDISTESWSEKEIVLLNNVVIHVSTESARADIMLQLTGGFWECGQVRHRIRVRGGKLRLKSSLCKGAEVSFRNGKDTGFWVGLFVATSRRLLLGN